MSVAKLGSRLAKPDGVRVIPPDRFAAEVHPLDVGVLYGVGLNYNFTPTISGRAEVQKPSSDSTNYGVGIVFKF